MREGECPDCAPRILQKRRLTTTGDATATNPCQGLRSLRRISATIRDKPLIDRE